jgi:hypothetical protein
VREEKINITYMVPMPSCYTGHKSFFLRKGNKSLMDFPRDVASSNRQHRFGICRVQHRMCFNPSCMPLSGDFL